MAVILPNGAVYDPQAQLMASSDAALGRGLQQRNFDRGQLMEAMRLNADLTNAREARTLQGELGREANSLEAARLRAQDAERALVRQMQQTQFEQKLALDQKELESRNTNLAEQLRLRREEADRELDLLRKEQRAQDAAVLSEAIAEEAAMLADDENALWMLRAFNGQPKESLMAAPETVRPYLRLGKKGIEVMDPGIGNRVASRQRLIQQYRSQLADLMAGRPLGTSVMNGQSVAPGAAQGFQSLAKELERQPRQTAARVTADGQVQVTAPIPTPTIRGGAPFQSNQTEISRLMSPAAGGY